MITDIRPFYGTCVRTSCKVCGKGFDTEKEYDGFKVYMRFPDGSSAIVPIHWSCLSAKGLENMEFAMRSEIMRGDE